MHVYVNPRGVVAAMCLLKLLHSDDELVQQRVSQTIPCVIKLVYKCTRALPDPTMQGGNDTTEEWMWSNILKENITMAFDSLQHVVLTSVSCSALKATIRDTSIDPGWHQWITLYGID